MSVARYVPERGDLLSLTFDPQAGHEQAGHSPALVLSPAAYNRRAVLALVCPITKSREWLSLRARLAGRFAHLGRRLGASCKECRLGSAESTVCGEVATELQAELIANAPMLRPLLGL